MNPESAWSEPRINLRTPLLAHLVRALTIVPALGLFWYGLMVVLLAVKVSPPTVNSTAATAASMATSSA